MLCEVHLWKCFPFEFVKLTIYYMIILGVVRHHVVQNAVNQ